MNEVSIQWKLIREMSEKTCFSSTTPEDFNADTCELSWNPLDQLWCPLRIVEVTRLASAHCHTVYLINEGGETLPHSCHTIGSRLQLTTPLSFT